ncbi:hypothetical protein [Pseudanabaena mucicola]|uniref:SPOR domain-containing protein n=1 Tax=Pseudanabaena mucicola FACHB-723 TaxID=2692860 RepID=A0ABR7ZUV5_9CYAN|nr:hypothetical protein [Pseudanabaena mucicola]MBD2187299.1 hypothetical protein [Pseudanabaena mucicola FACHB-723]
MQGSAFLWSRLINSAAGLIFLTSISALMPTMANAQAVSPPPLLCAKLTNRRYVVILDRPANQLPQLPEFLAIAAIPCNYLNASMTFFGGFDNVDAASFRAGQLRRLGLDAVIHSFSSKVNNIPSNLQASMVLVELNAEPNTALAQVRSQTGKSASLATFNNRSVIISAPLSSRESANAIATRLRSQGLAAQIVGAALIAEPVASATTANPKPSNPPKSSQAPSSQASATTRYRVLIPNNNSNTLKKVREMIPDAFPTTFKGKPYIQVRTYTDRANAHRERDRLAAVFSGTILIQN